MLFICVIHLFTDFLPSWILSGNLGEFCFVFMFIRSCWVEMAWNCLECLQKLANSGKQRGKNGPSKMQLVIGCKPQTNITFMSHLLRLCLRWKIFRIVQIFIPNSTQLSFCQSGVIVKWQRLLVNDVQNMFIFYNSHKDITTLNVFLFYWFKSVNFVFYIDERNLFLFSCENTNWELISGLIISPWNNIWSSGLAPQSADKI